MTRVLYIGNFGPANSTENHYAEAFENIGAYVAKLQESQDIWVGLPDVPHVEDFDFVMWTHTHNLSPESVHDEIWHALKRIRQTGTPTVAVHLDRWWGLGREHQTREPFFGCDYVFTADGGHDKEWRELGVNHYWLPPAVIRSQTGLGTKRPEFTSRLAFVGSWQGGYHAEWTHRPQLIEHLQRKWGRHCAFWPKRGEHAVRGQDLQDLYASVDVVIGDSCLVGNSRRYMSDRVPETIGRGGVLIHPYTEGLDGKTHYTGGIPWVEYLEGEDLATFMPFEFKELDQKIEHLLDSPSERALLRTNGMEKTLEYHTYEKRVETIIEVVMS